MKRLLYRVFTILLFMLLLGGSAIAADVTQVANAIKAEGSTLNIIGWGYWGLPESKWLPAFQKLIKDTYGVNIFVNWNPGAGGESLATLRVALAGKRKPPFDVYMTSRMWGTQMKTLGIAVRYFPDPLVPNAAKVPAAFKDNAGYWVNFQASSTLSIILNKKYVDESAISKIKDFKDLADPSLNLGKHLVLYSPTNAIGVGTLVAISRSLGLDYHKPADMTKTFNWIRDNLNPLVLQWISDEGVQDMLMQKEDGWVTISNPSFARLYIVNGMDIAQVFPTSGLQDRNGMALIAKDSEHQTLAKLWLNYVLGPEWQLQQYPDVEKGTLYGALESVVVPDYWKDMSDEGKAIETNPSQLTNAFYELDWAYLASQNEAWIQQFQDIVAK